jgi:D-proline reductase (dithiol) PrdB
LKYPFGHAMGEAFNRPQQKQIFRDCLAILETATKPGEIVDSNYRWKRSRFE